MPTQTIPMGAPVTIFAGIAYALPPVRVTLFTDAAPTLTMSDTQAFTLSVPVTITGGQASLAGGFLKTVADALITLKRD